MRILVVSFIYPKAKDFLKDFFISLNQQDYKNFDTLIVRDKYNKNLEKFNYKGKIIDNKNKLSVSGIRKLIINYAVNNNYEILVFADADDVMGKNRIKKIEEEYKKTNGKYGFYYNNLYLMENGEDFFKGKLPEMISDLEKIKDYNFLGMSHTSINIKLTKNIWKTFPVKDKIKAFDWYMHSYMLYKGFKGKKVDAETYYRIHENNTVGNVNTLDNKKLDTGIKVKKSYYSAMSKFDDSYIKKEEEIEKLEKKLKEGKNKKDYIKYINKNFKNSVYWWENIKTLDEIRFF
jgi:hypothetical protein